MTTHARKVRMYWYALNEIVFLSMHCAQAPISFSTWELHPTKMIVQAQNLFHPLLCLKPKYLNDFVNMSFHGKLFTRWPLSWKENNVLTQKVVFTTWTWPIYKVEEEAARTKLDFISCTPVYLG